jgi:hypothetical protein
MSWSAESGRANSAIFLWRIVRVFPTSRFQGRQGGEM